MEQCEKMKTFNFLLSTQQKERTTLRSACPIQLEMGEAERKEGSRRAQELRVWWGDAQSPGSHI